MYFGFKDVTIGFRGRTVLDNVTMDIPRGKIVTIIGQNGCGKSSLLKTVSKAVVPKRGQVIYNDKPINAYGPKTIAQHIAYLAQVHTSPPDIDVRTLVSYGRYPYLRLGRRLNADDWRIIDDTLRMTGLEGLAHRTLRTLSGGERQRIGIARVLLRDPDVCLMDEPSSALDALHEKELLHTLNTEYVGKTLMLISHRASTLTGCDRTLRMEDVAKRSAA